MEARHKLSLGLGKVKRRAVGFGHGRVMKMTNASGCDRMYQLLTSNGPISRVLCWANMMSRKPAFTASENATRDRPKMIS